MQKKLQLLFPVIFLTLSQATVVFADDSTTYGTNAGAALYPTADGNTLIGTSAGEALTYPDYNTFIGFESGKASVLGSDNVFLGYQAGLVNGNCSDNSFVGYQAGEANCPSGSLASDNSFFGYYAGHANVDGNDNTILGYYAAYLLTEGNDNLFMGYFAGSNVESATQNTAIGAYSMRGSPSYDGETGYGNVAFGRYVVRFLNSGVYNTYVAYDLNTNNNANFNTIMGFEAGRTSSDGDYNTFIGAHSGEYNNNSTYSSRNTYFGASAGEKNTSGEDNLVLGNGANFVNFDGYNRVVLAGASGLLDAEEIIALGYGASASNSSGAIIIGSGTQSSHGDAIAIGLNTATRSNNSVLIGNSNTLSWEPHTSNSVSLGSSDYRFSELYNTAVSSGAESASALSWTLTADAGEDAGDSWQLAAADGGELSFRNDISGSQVSQLTLANNGDLSVSGELYLNSDARLKTHIQPLKAGLSQSRQIQATRYSFKHEETQSPLIGSPQRTDSPQHLGLIAQQLETLLPELVNTEENGRKTVNYVALVPVLVNSVQSLSQQNKHSRAQLAKLKAQKQRLENLLAKLNGQLKVSQLENNPAQVAQATAGRGEK